MVKQLDQSNFQETLQSNEVVLVDFYADWCGPCQALKPTLDTLSTEFDGKATISKVNVDTNPELSRQYGVRSIPALFYFKDGQLVDQESGWKTKEQLTQKLDSLLN